MKIDLELVQKVLANPSLGPDAWTECQQALPTIIRTSGKPLEAIARELKTTRVTLWRKLEDPERIEKADYIAIMKFLGLYNRK